MCEHNVKYIGYVIRDGVVYYQYKCRICGEIIEVKARGVHVEMGGTV